MSRITQISIENFRVFKEKTTFDLAPITILTGPNNSGKSTLIKAFMILIESAKKENLLWLLRSNTETGFHTFNDLKSYPETNVELNSMVHEPNVASDKTISFVLIVDEFEIGNLSFKNVKISLNYSIDNANQMWGKLKTITISYQKERTQIFDWDNIYHTLNDDSDTKEKKIISRIITIISQAGIYIPTYRQNPQREFPKDSENFLAKKIFYILDHQLEYNKLRKDGKIFIKPKRRGEFFSFNFCNEILSESDLFGLGKLTFHPNNFNGNYELLLNGENIADLGFGMYQLIIMLVTIEIALIEKKSAFFNGDHKLMHKSVFIEEPEISLHPNFQSKIADILVAANKEGVNFIVETHSEYLIRKLQYLTAKGEIPVGDSLIYYLEPKGSKEKQLKKINILQDGRLTDDFGTGFVDEATKIIFDLWELRSQN